MYKKCKESDETDNVGGYPMALMAFRLERFLD